MKYLFLTFILLITLFSCGHSQQHGHGHHAPTKEGSSALSISPNTPPTNFPTVGFEKSHEVIVPFANTEVCPLFEPDGRNLIYDWWNPTVLREGAEGTLKGLVTVSMYHSHEIFLIVTEHNPDKGHLQYLVLWDDFELQKIDITCEQGATKNSTKIIWTERNAGIHENGVEMVSHFVEDGHLLGVVERYAKGVEDYLKNKSQGKN